MGGCWFVFNPAGENGTADKALVYNVMVVLHPLLIAKRFHHEVLVLGTVSRLHFSLICFRFGFLCPSSFLPCRKRNTSPSLRLPVYSFFSVRKTSSSSPGCWLLRSTASPPPRPPPPNAAAEFPLVVLDTSLQGFCLPAPAGRLRWAPPSFPAPAAAAASAPPPSGSPDPFGYERGKKVFHLQQHCIKYGI